MAALAARRVPVADMLKVPSGGGSSAAQAAYIRMGKVYDELLSRGADLNTLPDRMAEALVSRAGWTPEQASEIVGGFVDSLAAQRQPTTQVATEQPLLAAPKATPAPPKERRAKAQAAPVAPVETPQLPPLIQAAQEQATALYNDKPELADAFLEGIAFEIEGRKFDLTPVGSAVRSARKLGAEWYKTSGATLDTTMPAAPAPLATPEPPTPGRMKPLSKQGQVRAHPAVESVDDGGFEQFYVNLKPGFQYSEQRSFGAKNAAEALKILARVEPEPTPAAPPSVATREPEAPVAAPEAAAPQPPAEFGADAVMVQGYEAADKLPSRLAQRAFRQGLEEAMGARSTTPQEDIDKFTPKKRAAYQAGQQFVRAARGERASPTAISDQAIAENVKVKKGRTASAQGLKTTSREQIYTRDTVDPEPAGDITPEQQEQQAVYGEMEQAREALRINDADFAALVTLRRRGAPPSVVREELRRLSSKSKAGVEPTREGQMRGQTMSNAGQRYREGAAPATPMALEDTAAEVRRASKGWKNSPVFEVVDTFTSLPKGLQAVARPTMRGASVAAEDRVYIVADQHGSVEEVRATVFHEALGHAGLAKAFGEELRTLLNDLYNTNPKIKELTAAWLKDNPEAYADLDEDGRRMRAIEEVLVETVEDGAPQLPAIRRIFAALKDLLRKFLVAMGRKTMDYSNADVVAILAKASDTVMGGTPTRAADGETDPRFLYIGQRGATVAAAGGKEYADNQFPIAEEMEAEGLDPETIRLATGWFRNPYDDQWRYEIADKNAKLIIPEVVDEDGGSGWDKVEGEGWGLVPTDAPMRLDEVLDHPALFAAYPEARTITLTKKKVFFDFLQSMQGWYNEDTNTIGVTPYAKDPLSTILHEVQHYIQGKEGFARGGNPETALSLMPEARKQQLREDMMSGYAREYETLEARYELVSAVMDTEVWQQWSVADRRAVELFRDYQQDTTGNEALKQEWLRTTDTARTLKSTIIKAVFGVDGYFDLNEDQKGAFTTIFSATPTNSMQHLLKALTDAQVNWNAAKNDGDKAFERWVKKTGLGYKLYQSLAGEIEARDVQARMGLDDYELSTTTPLTSEKYDPADVLVTYGGGTAASQSAPPPPGGPTGAPPSTPNAPLGGKVEIAARLQSFVDNVTRKINYKYQDAEVAMRALLASLGLGKLSEDKDFAQAMRLYESSKGGQQEVLDRQFIKPLEGAIKASGLDINDIGMYLWARSAPWRNAKIAKFNGEFPDGGSGLPSAEAKAILDAFTARGLTPKLEAIAARADKLADHMLKLRVEAGLLTQDDVDAMRAEEPFYMPLKGFAKDGDMQTDDTQDPHEEFNQGKTARSAISEFRKAKGRKSMPFNPLLNLIVDASYATLRADTNEVGKTFLNALRAHPQELSRVATFYTKGKPKLKYSPKDPLTGKATAFAENLRMQTDELMVVKDGGELYFIEFMKTPEGAAMRRAFSNMRPEQMGKFMRGLTATTRTLKQLLTTRSPSYMAGPAFIRDVMDSYTSAVAAMTKKGGPAYGKPLAQAMRKHISPRALSSVAGYAFGKSPKTLEQAMDQLLLEQMVADGGSVGHSLIKSVETYAEDAAKRLQRHAKAKEGDLLAATREKLDAVGEVMDATAQMYDLLGRFATYKGALEIGISRKDAAELALDASLNLTRRGEWSSLLDSLFFFFSPTIEGARKFKNMGLSGRNGIKVMTSFAGIGTVLTLWNLMMSGDEDDDGRPDYLDINDMTRQTRAIVYYGSGPDDYVTMPLGFMGAYPQYVGSRIAEAAYGANNEESASALIMGATADLGRGLFSAMSPVRPSGSSAEDTAGSVMPSAVKPFFDVGLNRNFFNTPIYNKQFDARRARSTMGRESTEQFWHWMARSMNEMTGGSGTVAGAVDYQPEVYRYLVESFGGGPYRFLRDTVKTPERVEEDGVARALPLVRGFVGKGFEYVPMSNYYKHVNDLDAILWQEKNGTDEEWEKTRAARPVNTDPRVLDAYEAAKRELDRLARERREELAAVPPSDTEERQAIVDFYREAGRPAYEEFNRVREQVRKELGK